MTMTIAAALRALLWRLGERCLKALEWLRPLAQLGVPHVPAPVEVHAGSEDHLGRRHDHYRERPFHRPEQQLFLL